jgi:hypothetical protein
MNTLSYQQHDVQNMHTHNTVATLASTSSSPAETCRGHLDRIAYHTTCPPGQIGETGVLPPASSPEGWTSCPLWIMCACSGL